MKKSIYPMLKTGFVLLLLCLLAACSSDDNTPVPEPNPNPNPEPAMGYFVKTLQVSFGEGKMEFEFKYDNQNRISEERVTEEYFNEEDESSDDELGLVLGYRYNSTGEISEIWEDGELWAAFEYNKGILNKIILSDGSEFPVIYSDGIYTVDGGFQFIVDARQQLLGHENLGVRLTYADAPGIHRYLRPQPARFTSELVALDFYSMTVSRQAIATIELNGIFYDVNNKTDEKGNITAVGLIDKATGVETEVWKIMYEQRKLIE